MVEDANSSNIVLIGMPGVGKSTAGVLLAKRLSMAFLDTDLAVQAREGRRLQDILEDCGLDAFCRIEEETVLSLSPRRTVVATGGSVVYGPAAMRHLSKNGLILHLDVPYEELARRIGNLDSRGVAMPPGMNLRDLYERRMPLYRQWADVRIECAGLGLEEVVDRLEAAARGEAT